MIIGPCWCVTFPHSSFACMLKLGFLRALFYRHYISIPLIIPRYWALTRHGDQNESADKRVWAPSLCAGLRPWDSAMNHTLRRLVMLYVNRQILVSQLSKADVWKSSLIQYHRKKQRNEITWIKKCLLRSYSGISSETMMRKYEPCHQEAHGFLRRIK